MAFQDLTSYRSRLQELAQKNLLLRVRAKLYARQILGKIDGKRLERIQSDFADYSPAPGSSKYLDIEKWLTDKLVYALYLRVHRSKGMRVVDLGTGTGYFPFICNFFGCRAVGLDVDCDEIYREMVNLLGVERVIHRVEAFVPLPRWEERFDLATGLMVCFNNHRQENLWGVDEWNFFLQDLSENVLDPGGRIFLTLNREPSGAFCTDQLRNFLLRSGAVMHGNMVDFPCGFSRYADG